MTQPIQNPFAVTLPNLGVSNCNPPRMFNENRAPTSNDYLEFRLSDLWRHHGTDDLWFLAGVNTTISGAFEKAHWVNLSAGEDYYFTTDNGIAYPSTILGNIGNVNVLGGVNMHTEALMPTDDTITVNVIDHPVLAGGLTVTPFGGPGVVTTLAGGIFTSNNGTDGQIFVARPTGPQFVDLVSADASVIITESVDPLHPGGIDLKAAGGGGGGVTKLQGDDTLVVTPDIVTGIIKVIGDDSIKTLRTALDEITIGIEDSPVAGGILIGGGPGVPSAWGTLTSGDASITITPGVNTIDIQSVGAGFAGVGSIYDDAGINVTPDLAHQIGILGDDVISTRAVGLTEMQVYLNMATGALTPGAVLIGGAGGPTWANIVGAGGITVTNGANAITLTGGGGGAGAGIITLDLDSGVATDPGTHVVKIEGATTVGIDHVAHPYVNIQTYAPIVGGDLMQIRLSSAIQLPLTNSGGTAGLIQIGPDDFLHRFGNRNTFCGQNAGSRTLTVASCIDNSAFGANALNAINGFAKAGNYNTAVGSYAMRDSQDTNACVAVGYGALMQSLHADFNTALGEKAMGNDHVETNNNTAVGYHAMYNGVQLGAGGNTVIGASSLIAATSSTDNTILGYNVAPIATLAGYNTIAGASSAGSLSTGSYNVILGRNAADRISSGAKNVIIGTALDKITGLEIGAGSTLTLNDSNNVIINAPGVAGDNLTTRIGNTNLDANNATKCYLSGIYNKTIGNTNHYVGIDNTGKLGKVSNVAFSAYMDNEVYNVTGDGTIWYFTQLTQNFNVGGGVFTPGGLGGHSSFVIPAGASGAYYLTMSVRMNGLTPIVPPPAPPAPPSNTPLVIEIWRGGFSVNKLAYHPVVIWNGFEDFVSASFSFLEHLYAGDEVRWFVDIDYRPTNKLPAGRQKTIGFDGMDIAGNRYNSFGVSLLYPF